MSNKLKLELMEDLSSLAKGVIKDFYPDYFMWKEIDKESDTQMIELFDLLKTINDKRDTNNYETLAYDMWYYTWATTKKWISDSDKESLLDYIDQLEKVYEDNQYKPEDYDDDEIMWWLNSDEKYDQDRDQRKAEYNRIVNLINKI